MLPEILALIIDFVITKPNDKEVSEAEDYGRTRIMTTQDTPWPFMLVCKTWHEIIVSTPTLWSAFFAIVQENQYLETAHLPSMLDIYLRRSKNTPLTLCIIGRFNSRGSDNCDKAQFTIIDLLSRASLHQHRWEDVRLAFEGKRLAREPILPLERKAICLTMDFKDTVMLKRLHISLYYLPKYFGGYRVALARCDSLEDLELQGVPEILAPNTISKYASAYFPNLRTFYLSSSHEEMHHQNCSLLRLSPGLVDLKFLVHYRQDTQIATPMTPPLLLPKLLRLYISTTPRGLSLRCLQSMNLPSLAGLDLDRCSFDDESLFEIAGLVCRHPLTSLTLRIDNIAEQFSGLAFEAVLRSLPGLEHLSLINNFPTGFLCLEPLFRALARISLRDNDRSQHILSRLTSFELDASPSDLLIKKGFSSVIKDTVLACKHRYPAKFRLLIYCEDSSQDTAVLEDEATQSFLRDGDVRRCITDTFCVSVNRKYVEKTTYVDTTSFNERMLTLSNSTHALW